MSSRIETTPRLALRWFPALLGAAACSVLIGLPGAAAAPSRSLGGGSPVGTNVDDNYDFTLAQGVENVSAGDSLTGTHNWGFNVNNGGPNPLEGVQMTFDSGGSGNDYTDSKTFHFNYTSFPPDPNAFVSNHDCPAPTATQETCPASPLTLPPDTGAVTFFTGTGAPVTATPGFDATRTVTPIANSSESAVSVAVTLQDSRYAGGGADIRVAGFGNADTTATPTVAAGGQPLPSCSQDPQTACAPPADFGASQNASATCNAVSLYVRNAQVGTQYTFGWHENESGGGCPTGEPGVSVLGFTGGTPPLSAQACDAGTDCSVTQPIPGLGNATRIVAAGQITGMGVTTGPALYTVNFLSQNAPAPPSGTLSSAFGSSTKATDTATATNDNTTASATGVGSLTVSEWGSDPVTSPPFNASGQYFDVQVLSGSTFTTLNLKDCNLGGGSSLQWWTGAKWADVTPDDPPGITYDPAPPLPAPNCLTVELSRTSSPTLDQLTGTIFAVTKAPVLSLAKAKLKLAGKRVTLRLQCAVAACHGTATLRVAAKKKAKRVVLGRAKYRLAAGRTGTIHLTLNARGRKALARATRSRAYKGRLEVTVAHGAAFAAPVRITRQR